MGRERKTLRWNKKEMLEIKNIITEIGYNVNSDRKTRIQHLAGVPDNAIRKEKKSTDWEGRHKIVSVLKMP